MRPRSSFGRAAGVGTAVVVAALSAPSCGGGDDDLFAVATGAGGSTSTTSTGGVDAGADAPPDAFGGCATCAEPTPICVDGAACAEACPPGRVQCHTDTDPAAASGCCGSGDQCCTAAAIGWPGADLCVAETEPCPKACPDGTTLCAQEELCQLDPATNGWSCVDACPPASQCFGGICCPLGTSCAGGACALPDLTIDADQVGASAKVTIESFAADACEIVEGCIGAPGERTLLRFDLETPNVGAGDLELGVPGDAALFTYSDCHGHYHFNGYADYKLLDAAMNVVGTGHKQAFCLLDLEQVDPNASPTQKYNCDFQGIQAGWADVYSRDLPCQWVDVTGVAPGDYLLEVTVNGEQVLGEASYDNNHVLVPVTVPANSCPGGCKPSDEGCCAPGDPCGWGADGSCDCGGYFGWDAADCATCLVGGCGIGNTCPAGCSPNQGACCADGDPCGLAANGACDCAGALAWDAADCAGCTTTDPDCPVDTCPNGCTPADGNPCCASAQACGWDHDGWCDCGGAAWDAADCAMCLSNEPDCP